MASTTFGYTGAQQTFVVPVGVTVVTVECWGAQGQLGGYGGYVKADHAVTPGETLYVNVGGQNGWNGGGASPAWPAGGGGMSDVRRGGTTTASIFVVAGGGGGYFSGNTGFGGLNPGRGPGPAGGYGATYNAGGAAGGVGATAGRQWQGGDGGTDGSNLGGGGGGGAYGGGGGYGNSGGGGGRSEVYGNISAPTFVDGVRYGDGQVVITTQVPTRTLAETLPAATDAVSIRVSPNRRSIAEAVTAADVSVARIIAKPRLIPETVLSPVDSVTAFTGVSGIASPVAPVELAPPLPDLVLQPVRGIVDVSERFTNELVTASQLHTIACAEVWAGNVRVATFTIDPQGSSFGGDRANPSRRNGTLVLTEGEAWADDGTLVPVVPGTPQDVFLPYGSEIVLYSGLAYGDGTQELVQLGIGSMEDVGIDDTEPNVVVTLNFFDRAKAISRSGFIANTPLPLNTEVGLAIQMVFATLQLPFTLIYNFANSGALTPGTATVYVPGDDPMQMGMDLAVNCGFELYFDPKGVLCFLPLPNQNLTQPSFSYFEGAGNTTIELNRLISRANAPNYVIRAGTGTGASDAAVTFPQGQAGVGSPAPVQSLPPHGIDLNPASPTFLNGTYGRQVDYNSSALIVTQAQADKVADTDLLKALGKIDSITLTAIPLPDTDVDDVVLVSRARSKLIAVPYVVDSFQLTFGSAGTMVIVARAVTSPVD